MSTQKPATLPPNTKVGPFRIIRPLNEAGGMATLYLAQVRERYRRGDIPDRVALKVAREEFEDFLKAEADILARLAGQPHIVRVYRMPSTDHLIYWTTDFVKIDHHRSEKLCFMAMEYVGGGSLRRWLDARKSLGSVPALQIAQQVAEGLASAHRNQIVHLDIKPENILFRSRRLGWLWPSTPEVVLCDFGLARDLTQRHALVVRAGTEEYMAPELFFEHDWNVITCSADVYMLGVVVYEMLTGQLPFESLGKKLDPAAEPQQIQNQRVPQELVEVVMRALKRNPIQRPANGEELLNELARVPAGIDVEMVARQVLAGIATAGLLTGLTWGGLKVISDIAVHPPTPTTIATRPASNITLTPLPTITPLLWRPTSTPVNTFVPTPTPVPPTRTPTPVETRQP